MSIEVINMRLNILIAFLAAFLLIGTTFAFTPLTIPNFQAYQIINISSNSFVYSLANPSNALQNLNLSTDYTYLPYNTLNPQAQYPYILISGYKNGSFEGNITAYPFHNGLLINKTTSSGNTYNSLVIYYNQFTKDALSVPHVYIYQNNLSYGSRLISYGLNLSATAPAYVKSNLTQQEFNWNNVKTPYFFLSGLGLFNATLYYYPHIIIGTTTRLAYYSYANTIQKINIGDTFFNTYVSNTASNIELYLNSSGTYGMAAQGLVMVQNNYSAVPVNNWYAYNATTNTGTLSGFFYSPYNYNLHLYSFAPAAEMSTYYLVPAYANISVISASNASIANPVRPKLNVNLTWYYSLPIENVNWTYHFNTTKLDNGAQQFSYTNSSVKYLLLTMQAYTELGNLAKPQVEAYTDVSGINYTMPVSVVSYNSSYITLAIAQNATAGAVKNFTLLFNNSLGDSFTTSLPFSLSYSGAGSIVNTTLYAYPIVQLSRIPASTSYIKFITYDTGSGYLQNATYSFPTSSTLAAFYNATRGSAYTPYLYKQTTLASTTFIPSGIGEGGFSTFLTAFGVISQAPTRTYLYNLTSVINESAPEYTGYLGAILLSKGLLYNLSAKVNLTLEKPYTTNYTLGSITPIIHTNATKNNTRPALTTTILYNTTAISRVLNNSMPYLTANGSLVSNTSFIATLTTNTTIIHGFAVPKSVSYVLLFVVIIGLFIVISKDNVIADIIYLIVVWLMGLTDFNFVIISMLITAIVFAGELIKKDRRDKHGH